MGNGLFSQQMELIGDHAVAEMVLRLNLGCAENFYGPNCNLLCDTSQTICEGRYNILNMVTGRLNIIRFVKHLQDHREQLQ